ncbi:MAG: hypothetical protein A2136_00895 [Chloroflexi bacterium RBG_16_54_11]|nr:MAG: hypothetical protein A2136_00895 [Chloroflexi bacterium RBG_16_54_11]
MTNHLAGSGSPYLLQHAENPVDWHPWGREALDKARLEDKPIFLSIGYAACHWCHVMAHESFEDPGTAALMNANFVNIKVDREERPDLDSIYMSFVVAITGQGGWPMSVFLTPEGKPFYGGTYFSPSPSHNLPAFRELLEAIARLWREDRNQLVSSSEDLVSRLQTASPGSSNADALDTGLLDQVIRTISRSYDWQNGGWGAAPKFPQPMLIEFLLRQASRGDRASLKMVTHALEAMAQGGMYDILGGGFARYSVDPTWLLPHFEKMLYDNALLTLAYLHAYQLTGDAGFREVCEASLDFVLRELTHPLGGFYSSLDADSEGEEGKYYLWTSAEIRSALSGEPEADLFMAAYGVSHAGNFDGRSILRRSLSDDRLAQQFDMDGTEVQSRLADLRQRLLVLRNQRVHPATDDKLLVFWNALMLSAFAEAGRALGRPEYTQQASRAADFILGNMLQNDRLTRSWRSGVASHNAYLEDYAALALGLLSLYQSEPNPRWYRAALELAEQVLAHFTDPEGGFFDTSDDHETLIYRPKDLQDNATPSGNAQTAMLFLQLSTYEGRSDWRLLAEQMLSSIAEMMKRYPTAFAYWLCATYFALGGVHEVAIMGDFEDPATQSLLHSLWRGYHPRLVMASSRYPPPVGSPALLLNRPLLDGKPTAYVCQDFVCQRPVNTVKEMWELLHPGVLK